MADESLIDRSLEASMDEVLKIVVLGRACRNEAAIKNRQPIATMFIKSEEAALDEFFTAIIAGELNVKEVRFTNDVRAFTSYAFKPQLKTVGPKYGKFLGAIRNHLSSVDGNEAMDELNANGALVFTVDGTEISLTADDLLIEMTQKPGYVSNADQGFTVVLDTNLTPELIEEGTVREIISKVQTMRKDNGFEVTDHIRLGVANNETLLALVQKNAAEIADEVLADEIVYTVSGGAREWSINGEKLMISADKI